MTKSAFHTKQNTRDANRSNAAALQRQTSLGPHVCVQRQANAAGVAPEAPSLVQEALNSPGRPLDSETRSFMEPRLGYDLSGVRVHNDGPANESARALHASAYTTGSHVVFGNASYAPETATGRRLIAHELTHVVQQAQGPVHGVESTPGLSVSDPSDKFEQQARGMAGAIGNSQMPVSNDAVSSLPASRPVQNPVVQLADSDLSSGVSHGVADTSMIGGIGGGISAIVGIIGLVPAFESAAAAKRQAVAGEKQAAEAEKANVIATENLDVAKQALLVAQNPPAPAPTTGGIVINNNGGYGDVPSVSAPKSSAAKAGDEKEASLTVLRVSQGTTDFANVDVSLKTDGKNIKGGYLQDGAANGYLGGSAASNLNLTLKPVAGPPFPHITPKGTATTIAGVRFLISGNNIAPRSNSGTPIQHFSGAVNISAAGEVILSEPFNKNLGTVAKGKSPADPAVTIDLPASAPKPVGPAPSKSNPAPGKAGGAAPAPGGSGATGAGAK